jgi:hypothetical protein
MSPQRELSRILLSMAFHFHSQVDYNVSLERIITDFSLSGLSFSFPNGVLPCLLRENHHGFFPQWLCIFILSGFIPCLLRENYHGCCLQWLYIFIPQLIFTVSPQRELSRILPSLALYFHPSADLHHVSSERTFTDFTLSGFIFSSLSGFVPCLLRENFQGFYPQ